MQGTKDFDIICAVDSKEGIGKDNRLPWRLSEESTWFREVTTRRRWPRTKNVVIMGRKTWQSLPENRRPLPDRTNIVISTTITVPDGVVVAKDLEEALSKAWGTPLVGEVFVIGGAQVYATALQHPALRDVYLTTIEHDYGCDTFFRVPAEFTVTETSETYTEKDRILGAEVRYRLTKSRRPSPSTSPHPSPTPTPTPTWVPDHMASQGGESQYLTALRHLLDHGDHRQTRNSMTYSTFGTAMYFDLATFPILTTKRIHLRGVFEELKFFLQGKSDATVLSAKGVKIWDQNTSAEFLAKCDLPYRVGDMGPMYGPQLRAYGSDYGGCDADPIGKGIDQIRNSLDLLLKDPGSRRNLLTTYDPSRVHLGVLYPCHGICIQFYVSQDHRLSCHMTQRSADVICGLPFNIASYALLVHIYCQILNGMVSEERYRPGRLMISIGDLHLYDQPDHIACAREQLGRTPYPAPRLTITRPLRSIDDISLLEFSDLVLDGYETHPAIKVQMVA